MRSMVEGSFDQKKAPLHRPAGGPPPRGKLGEELRGVDRRRFIRPLISAA